VIGLLVAVLLAQQPVPSTLVPPAAEERVVFSHAGYTYFVGNPAARLLPSNRVVFDQSHHQCLTKNPSLNLFLA
jgi:hypothetical protein